MDESSFTEELGSVAVHCTRKWWGPTTHQGILSCTLNQNSQEHGKSKAQLRYIWESQAHHTSRLIFVICSILVAQTLLFAHLTVLTIFILWQLVLSFNPKRAWIEPIMVFNLRHSNHQKIGSYTSSDIEPIFLSEWDPYFAIVPSDSLHFLWPLEVVTLHLKDAVDCRSPSRQLLKLPAESLCNGSAEYEMLMVIMDGIWLTGI